MSDDLTTKVLQDIQKTGFPLELRVAQRLRTRGYYVATNVYFVDKDEAKGREVDLRALKNAFLNATGLAPAVRHCLLIECKKSSSRPWVFFTSPTVSYDQNISAVLSNGVSSGWCGSPREYDSMQRQHPWFKQPFRGRSFYEAFSNAQEANQNIAKATLSAIKASIDARDAEFAAGYPMPNAIFYYPLVVLEGELFTARLSASRLILTRASQVPVSVHYQSSQYTRHQRHTVLVVTERALPKALKALDLWLKLCSAHFKAKPTSFAPVPSQRKRAHRKRLQARALNRQPPLTTAKPIPRQPGRN